MLFLGVDLAWAIPDGHPANATGVACLDTSGRILDAGWTVGVEGTVEWIDRHGSVDSLVFVDAPLIVRNCTGQRMCEKQVGQRYGQWNVSANSTNTACTRLAGIHLLRELELKGWTYSDGLEGPPTGGRIVSECYPYTTIVGVAELGYDTERPRYKRCPRRMRASDFRPIRAAACDDLIVHLADLASFDPPLNLRSHPATATLVNEHSPCDDDAAYKRREDLLDAVLCAWTAALWWRFGFERCQVLGTDGSMRPAATIIAPARPDQRVEAALA